VLYLGKYLYLETNDLNHLHMSVLFTMLAQHSSITVLEPNVIFGRPFVKRFAVCYRTVVPSVCLSVLSVTLVHCGQTVGQIKTKLGMQISLSPGHIVLDGDPAPPLPMGHSPQFSAHICCGQTAAWIKMPLGMEVGLGVCDIVLDGDPAPPPLEGTTPNFCQCQLWSNGWMD